MDIMNINEHNGRSLMHINGRYKQIIIYHENLVAIKFELVLNVLF